MSTTDMKRNEGSSEEAEPKTAKLFKNGRSQAVRLPKEFRFDGNEVAIRRNPETGEVILAPAPAEAALCFDEWFALYDALQDDAPEEAYANLPPQPKGLTRGQVLKVIDRAHFPRDFMADRKTSVPRGLDLF